MQLTPKAVWRRLKRYSYYFPGFTPHVCRHTFATHMARVVDRYTLMLMLGHSSRSATDLYVHPGPEEVRRAMLERHYLLPLEPKEEG